MSQGSLHWLLHATNRRLLFARLTRALLVGVLAMLAILFLVVVLDGIIALPITARIAIDAVLGLLCLGGLGYLIRLVYKNRFEPRRVARMISMVRRAASDDELARAVGLHQ